MNEKTVYRCNVCYLKKGVLLNSCGCFYCSECFKDSKSYINIEKVTCYGCGKSIDYSKTIDITNKESVKKVEFIYDEPEIQLKKIIEVIKFQKLHKGKYIEFLEKKVEELTKENVKLKESVLNGRAELLNLSNKAQAQNNNSLAKINIGVNAGTGSNQYLDLKQIKKIEPKKPDKNSTKGNKNLPNNNDYVKIDNLNAKTAEIMKQSPGMNNNFQNFNNSTNYNLQTNQRALINVNINNSNKLVKDDVTNYEKNLFKQPTNSNANNNNVNNNNQNVNPYYQNQKRKYVQMNNYYNEPCLNTNTVSNSNANAGANNNNYQTPLPNNCYYDFQKTKRFKHN